MQASEADIIRQIEYQLSPVVVNEVKMEYQEKKKTDGNITYQKDNQGLKRSSAVNPSQLQYANNELEDKEFLTRLFNIQKEYGS